MTIDPYEVLIEYLLDQASLTALVSTRISVKHQYGYDWASNATGLVVSPNGGLPNLYNPVQKLNVQLRIYSDSIQQGMAVWKVLNDISRTTAREVVAVTGGNGLLYWLNPTSGPALITDGDLEKDIVLINFDTQIGEIVVT